VASDEDLKLSDTLRYYMRDSAAAKNLLYRRLRALANYEAATKNLEKARSKNKDVQAVSVQCCTTINMCVRSLSAFTCSLIGHTEVIMPMPMKFIRQLANCSNHHTIVPVERYELVT